jgi:predicted AlkP superfamily phosphohydrolase/phosphomutase
MMKGLRGNWLLSAALRLLPERFVRTIIDGLSSSSGAYDLGSVDWDGTSAYATIHGIYLNEAVVEDREAVLGRIEEGLKGLRGRDGRPLDVRVWRRESLYSGDMCERMPHLVYCIEGHAFEPFSSLETGDPLMYFDKEFKGWHREEGILIASGPDFAQGPAPEASISDVAPTVLHLFGAPVPRKMDGRVVREMFKEGSAPSIERTRYVDGDPEEEMRIRRAIKRIRQQGAAPKGEE